MDPPREPPRPAGPITPTTYNNYYNLRSEADYLLVSVVPVLLSTLVLALLQVLITSLNSILPFRALGQQHGTLSEDSLDLTRNPSLLSAPFIAGRFLAGFKDPLPLLSTLLTVVATVLVTLSSDVIRLEVTTDCSQELPEFKSRHLQVCAIGLRKSVPVIRVAEGLIVALGILIIAIAILLTRWRSGVAADPWSIASMASMISLDGELHKLLRSIPGRQPGRKQDIGTHIRRALGGRRYRLGYTTRSDQPTTGDTNTSPYGYGIQIVPTSSQDNAPIQLTVRDPPNKKAMNPEKKASLGSSSSWTWELTVRIMALLFTLGLLILILYYENTVGVETGFEFFMNSQTVGVRILFAAFGTTIDAFWNYYFFCKLCSSLSNPFMKNATSTKDAPTTPTHVLFVILNFNTLIKSISDTSQSQIHQLLAKKPHRAETSILLSPPSNIFLGLWRSAANIKQDLLSFQIALATFLAKFTPILLSNIPFSNTVTWKIHEACTWLAVAFLSHMVLVLAVSLLLPVWRAASHRFLHRPATKDGAELLVLGTDTIAGCMYYLYDSPMLKDFEGLFSLTSGKGHKERDRLVAGMNRWYSLAERKVTRADATGDAGAVGAGGETRVRVDYV